MAAHPDDAAYVFFNLQYVPFGPALEYDSFSRLVSYWKNVRTSTPLVMPADWSPSPYVPLWIIRYGLNDSPRMGDSSADNGAIALTFGSNPVKNLSPSDGDFLSYALHTYIPTAAVSGKTYSIFLSGTPQLSSSSGLKVGNHHQPLDITLKLSGAGENTYNPVVLKMEGLLYTDDEGRVQTTGPLVTVDSGSTFVLGNNIRLQGYTSTSGYNFHPLVYVNGGSPGGIFRMEGGVLAGNAMLSSGAGVHVGSGGTLEKDAGTGIIYGADSGTTPIFDGTSNVTYANSNVSQMQQGNSVYLEGGSFYNDLSGTTVKTVPGSGLSLDDTQ
jgi:hypothetical protein